MKKIVAGTFAASFFARVVNTGKIHAREAHRRGSVLKDTPLKMRAMHFVDSGDPLFEPG